MRIDIGQLEFMDKKLRNILLYLEKETGYDFTITSLYRMGDDGVHGQIPLRGTDLRMRNREVGVTVAKLINDRWMYNPDDSAKLCALLHGTGSNLHLHLQVHPNTIQK